MRKISRPVGFFQSLSEDGLSYNISRRYPFRRQYKLLLLLVSIVALGLITVFNLATNGFDKQPTYTNNPNATEQERHWYQHRIFTWGDDKLDPKCQNADIPVGHEFMTTNLGLRYTVRRILYFEPGSSIGQQRSSVSYHDNHLQNCETNVIGIYLRKADFSRPNRGHTWWSWMDSSADAVARCDIVNDEGFFTLEFLVKYSTLVEDYSYVAVDNATTHASLWWGARLLNAYFVGTQYVMSGKLPDSNNNTAVYTRATLSYHGKNITDMKDSKLFDNWYFFLTAEGTIFNQDNAGAEDIYNNEKFDFSRPLTEGFFFARVFRSLILTDLGNSKTPNLLLDADLLQYALNPADDDFNRKPDAPLHFNKTTLDWWKFTGIPRPGMPLRNDTIVPMHEAYSEYKDETGPLGTKPATIYAKYICSKPEKKSPLASVLFTLVATLALFQAASTLFYTILLYSVDQKVQSTDPTANFCEGCLRAHGNELATVSKEGSSGVESRRPGGYRSLTRSSSTRELLMDEDLDDGNRRY